MTAQTPDTLLHAGREWKVWAEPLRPWLRAHPDVARSFSAAWTCTANWRGYLAEWAVNKGHLELTRVSSKAIQSPDMLQVGLPLLAGWVTGELALLNPDMKPTGESWGSERPSHTSELAVMTVEAGKVVNEQRFLADVWRGIGGLGIRHEGPPLRGLVGDGSYWGIGTGERLRPARAGWRDSEPPAFDESTDCWGLRKLITAAGLRDPATARARDHLARR